MSSDDQSDLEMAPPPATPAAGTGKQQIEDADEDTIRIMVSTDNHLGYAEGDAVRGDDSFAAMEEVLYLAKHYRADMVLLAGDLFHENKPSRRTLHKTMELFRRYCLGPDPVAIQILSDQSQNFRKGLVNYESPFYSVDLPVFSIHGNHDDPTREGTDLYAALDLLDCANLVNYVGRQEEINQVQVSPILMKKGITHLALYGLGSMRDERLNRMWRGQKLAFLRPEEDNDTAWFNLFALHQNRDLGRGTKNCVQESMIPEWMDLVCWGHEHECCIEPQESVVGTFRITQPGSSVATSLTTGESQRKQVGILDIRGQQFRLSPVTLTQVRSFVLGEISLQQQRRLDPDDHKIEQKVSKILQEQVAVLIHDAHEKARDQKEAAQEAGNPLADMDDLPLKNTLDKPNEVLVRLKVEHSGFSTLNNQRFGAKFVGEVANATDILLFHRKKLAVDPSITKRLKDMQPIAPEELEEMNIEDLIEGELEQSDKKLELFDEKRIAGALEEYVQKQQVQAIPEIVSDLLKKQQKKLITRAPEVVSAGDAVEKGNHEEGDQDVNVHVDSPKSQTTRKRAHETDGNSEDEVNNKHSKLSSHLAKKAPARRARSGAVDADSGSDSDIVEVVQPKRGQRTAPRQQETDDKEDLSDPPQKPKRAPRRKGRTKANYSIQMDSDNDDDDVVEVVQSQQPRKRRAAAPSRNKRAASSTPTSSSPKNRLSQSQLSFAPSRKTPRRNAKPRNDYGEGGSDDEDLTPSRSYDSDDNWGTAKTDTYKS